MRVRDLTIAGRPTYLSGRKRRYRCGSCERSFIEHSSCLVECLPAIDTEAQVI